jgi:hypothetical protein
MWKTIQYTTEVVSAIVEWKNRQDKQKRQQEKAKKYAEENANKTLSRMQLKKAKKKGVDDRAPATPTTKVIEDDRPLKIHDKMIWIRLLVCLLLVAIFSVVAGNVGSVISWHET